MLGCFLLYAICALFSSLFDGFQAVKAA